MKYIVFSFYYFKVENKIDKRCCYCVRLRKNLKCEGIIILFLINNIGGEL